MNREELLFSLRTVLASRDAKELQAIYRQSHPADIVSVLEEDFSDHIHEFLPLFTGEQRAVIFGSYAARATGEPGPPPGDIDLLLIGDISFEDGYDLAHAASRELGMEVNPVIRTVEEWENDGTGFAAEVRARPTLVLKGPSAGWGFPAGWSAAGNERPT
jgi:hypothetical protein